MAGYLGLAPGPFTARQIFTMARGRQRKEWEIAQWISWNIHAWGMKQSTMPLDVFNPWLSLQRSTRDTHDDIPYVRPPGSIKVTRHTIDACIAMATGGSTVVYASHSGERVTDASTDSGIRPDS